MSTGLTVPGEVCENARMTTTNYTLTDDEFDAIEFPTDDDCRAYLMSDGNLSVPCSRYGRNTADCADVAIRVANLIADANGDPITSDALDYVMGLVVNDHDDVAHVLTEHGGTVADYEAAGMTAADAYGADPLVTASEWHGGQSSALYSLASTGEIHRPLADYVAEIEACRATLGLPDAPVADYDGSPGRAMYEGGRLDALEEYVTEEAAAAWEVTLWDNGSETFDRYTAIYKNDVTGESWYRGMSENPFHPQGFGQAGEGDVSGVIERDEEIAVTSAPEPVQRCIAQDLAGSIG